MGQYSFYFLPLLFIWGLFLLLNRKGQAKVMARIDEANRVGLRQPPSLHPYIDPARCMGCGSCAKACPEGDVIGLVNGKAQLVEGANCIGHGACKEACPFDAIELVFGTQERGVVIPDLTSHFESSRPGVFVAGELGGMGLIKNAVAQGRQAIDAIVDKLKATPPLVGGMDVVIVGAGPAGITAALAAKERGLEVLVIEQAQTFGGTVANFPRRKLVMTQPLDLPIVGKLNYREVAKEVLINRFKDIVNQQDIAMQFGLTVDRIDGTCGDFTVGCGDIEFHSRTILLCLGRRGLPRKLGVMGEDKSKVTYSLEDPEQYVGESVLVVGGGDSALEAACDLAEAGADVTLSYRGESFNRAKAKNRHRLEGLMGKRLIQVMMQSEVLTINDDDVVLTNSVGVYTVKNQRVVICAGGVPPTQFLEAQGIRFSTKFGEPL